MDAFYASVELLRHPELRGRPVVVGGAGARGVVAAASYEARWFGVHSAMPSVRARRLCPNAVFLDGDHAHYGAVSARLRELFGSFSPVVEPLSLDEAFLDISGARRRFGTFVELGHQLRRQVREQEGLSCSIGIAPNKFLAKLATNRAKPTAGPRGPLEGSGVHEVEPGRELEFLHPLPVQALWGVGPATLAKLQRLGVRTVGDLARTPVEALVASVGRAAGEHLHQLSHGRDERPVVAEQAPRSVSHEQTFRTDLHRVEDLHPHLVRMSDAVAARLRRARLKGRTVQLKVRYGDFSTVTRSRTLAQPTDRTTDLVQVGAELLGALPVQRGVRLLGIGASGFADGAAQLEIDLDGDGAAADWDAANGAVDAIRDRFGSELIGPARLAGAPGALGANPWGPIQPDETDAAP